MKNVRMITALIGMSLLFGSCATMFSGTRYTAHISATRPGSEIYVDGNLEGMDEVRVRPKRKDEILIEVKNQEKVVPFTVARTIKWGSQVANLLNWFYFIPVGTIIDLSTGGIWQPEHKQVPEVTKVNNKVFQIKIVN